MTTTYNTIKLLLRDEPFEKEAPLGDQTYDDVITPGMSCQLEADGTILPFATVALSAPIRIAVEFGLDGRGVDDDYAVEGETVVYHIPTAGEELYMWLEAAGNVAKGALLENNGEGYLQAATSYAQFRACEACNNAAGSGPKRIRVEVI